jgi:hypothetical protein
VAESGSQIVEVAVYKLAGLRIVSDFPLSGLPVCHDNAAAQPEVVIRRAPVPEVLASVGTTFPNRQYNGKELLLDFPAVGRFLLRGGDEILVDSAPSSDEGEIRAHLLGTAFGALCHQRGMLPLHSSVIDVADGCIAFVGESGAGKSTLAAALAARGHQVIADDVCFLQLGNKRGDKRDVQVWPGIHRIRLWEDTVAALGCEGPGVEREMRGYNKYLIPVHPPTLPVEPRQLRGVYQLCAAPDGSCASVSRLRGAAAIEVLLRNVYRLGLAEYMGYKPAVFAACATTANTVPVFRFSRPFGFDTLREGVGFLEDHLRDIC